MIDVVGDELLDAVARDRAVVLGALGGHDGGDAELLERGADAEELLRGRRGCRRTAAKIAPIESSDDPLGVDLRTACSMRATQRREVEGARHDRAPPRVAARRRRTPSLPLASQARDVPAEARACSRRMSAGVSSKVTKTPVSPSSDARRRGTAWRRPSWRCRPCPRRASSAPSAGRRSRPCRSPPCRSRVSPWPAVRHSSVEVPSRSSSSSNSLSKPSP